MPEKLDRCVNKVKAKGGVDNPWAVCNASVGKNGVKEKVNANRQVPVPNPPIKVGSNKPAGKKTVDNGGENRLNMGPEMWKSILDAQLKRNVKEPKV